MMKCSALLLWGGVAIALISQNASAEMYRYVDDQGALHFVDDLSQVPKKHRKKARSVGDDDTYTPSQSNVAEKRKAHEEKKVSATNVEMYITSWCPTCKYAVKYMREQGIPFAAYDIEKDADAKKRFDELGDRNPGLGRIGVPLIIVGQHSMRGFDAQRLESWLGRQSH